MENFDGKMYLEAPDKATEEQIKAIFSNSIFLYGGITGCDKWQERAAHKLSMLPNLFILNPRRKGGFMLEGERFYMEEMERQIEWEYQYSNMARQKLFWFTRDTVQPITLYELGKELGQRYIESNEGYGVNPIWIGVDPLYERRWDIIHQVRLIAPDLPIYFSLEGMLDAVAKDYFEREALSKKTQPSS